MKVTTLFLDIGGVLLTNGWGSASRRIAAERFKLDSKEMEERHHLTFDTYEEGKLTLDEYLDRVVFYEQRTFSKKEFILFMFEQSVPFEETIVFFKELKKQYRLKIIVVSNEGRELNEHRIQKYKLNELFDAYISSCYVHMRKPDKDILRMACDISQTRPDQALYIDDRLMFVEIASAYGLQSLHYQDLNAAKAFIKTVSFHTAEDKKE